MEKKITLVMPAFNEEENIEEAVCSAASVLSNLPINNYEILIVNDGSTDRTGEILENLTQTQPHLTVINFPKNKGYGAALRAGFESAKYEYIFYTDSDNQFDMREIKNFLPAIEDYDAVVGFRIYRFDPFARLFLSWGYNILIRLVFWVKVRDVDCAFKLFRKKIFEKIKIKSNDFFVDTEIIAKIKHYDFKITEIGVRHYPRKAGMSTVRASHILSTLKELARIWYQIHYQERKRN